MTTHVPDRAGFDGSQSVRSALRERGTPLLDADAISKALSRISHEIIERNDDLGRLALVGIQTRGVWTRRKRSWR